MSPPRETPVEVNAPDAPKKAKKPRAKKEKVAAIPLDLEAPVEVAPAAAPKKEKKTRAKKAVAPVPVPVPVQEEEEEEIHTQEIVIGDKTYLLDGENNIYSVETHDHIGTFDSEKNVVVEIAN